MDGELLAACRQYHHLHSQESPINAQIRAASREQHASLWEALEALWDQQDDILVVITDLRAKTPEGLRAKALVADVVTRRRQKMEIENDCLTDEHRLNLSLIADLLERKVG
ncbi:hypothetical protein [Acidisoma cladoniae]|uniref:hypothetical protein n=1 Tax=Acidisoma cladoniae TaxID=3040935 RepID=UPI00254DF6C9|nr:hypothetical protein [Acidisoma sp. PAMC 29798]